MAENQNPVFTDNTTLAGDGTEENPLGVAAVGGITEITSGDGSITVTNPDGPSTDLSVNGGGLVQPAVANRVVGPVVIDNSGSFEELIESPSIRVKSGGQILVFATFVITPETGITQVLFKCVKDSDGSQVGMEYGEVFPDADNNKFYTRTLMFWESSDEWTDGDAVHIQAACSTQGASFTAISVAAFLIPAGFNRGKKWAFQFRGTFGRSCLLGRRWFSFWCG